MARRIHKKHPLVFKNGVLGFHGYEGGRLFGVIANGDNNFLNYGITKDSLLIVDPDRPFKKGKINVFQTDKIANGGEQLKLSLTSLDYPYVGQVILSTMQYR